MMGEETDKLEEYKPLQLLEDDYGMMALFPKMYFFLLGVNTYRGKNKVRVKTTKNLQGQTMYYIRTDTPLNTGYHNITPGTIEDIIREKELTDTHTWVVEWCSEVSVYIDMHPIFYTLIPQKTESLNIIVKRDHDWPENLKLPDIEAEIVTFTGIFHPSIYKDINPQLIKTYGDPLGQRVKQLTTMWNIITEYIYIERFPIESLSVFSMFDNLHVLAITKLDYITDLNIHPGRKSHIGSINISNCASLECLKDMPAFEKIGFNDCNKITEEVLKRDCIGDKVQCVDRGMSEEKEFSDIDTSLSSVFLNEKPIDVTTFTKKYLDTVKSGNENAGLNLDI